MKTITYTGGGPDIVTMGVAGQFKIGEPRPDIPEDLAAQLLARKDLSFTATTTKQPHPAIPAAPAEKEA